MDKRDFVRFWVLRCVSDGYLILQKASDSIHCSSTDRYSLPQTLELFNTLRPRQDGRHYPDDIFKCIFLNENVWISIEISLKFVPKGPINNIPSLVQKMAWRRPGDKPLSEPMMARFTTNIYASLGLNELRLKTKHSCMTDLRWLHTYALNRRFL